MTVAVCSRSFSKNIKLREKLDNTFSNVKFNEFGVSLSGKTLIDFLQGYEKAIVGLERIDRAVLSELPCLKVVSKYGVGLDNIDLVALMEHDVSLGWTGGVNKRSVSELVLGFAIGLSRHFINLNRDLANGIWCQFPGTLLSHKTVGVVGCGHVGKDLISLLKPFDCDILINDIVDQRIFCVENHVTPTPLEDVFSKSDIISLHLPLTDATRGLVGPKLLNLMKKDAILINTSRGGIVDEVALSKKLEKKEILGAAFDVFANEPTSKSVLFGLDNFIGTPHVGGSTDEAVQAMGIAAIDGLSNYKNASFWINSNTMALY